MKQNPFCSRQRKTLRPDHGRIDDVVIVVVRNVIGHNIGFWFGYLAGCLTPVFTDSAGFYSRYPSDQSASCGNFPQLLLWGCCFSTLVFAKKRRARASARSAAFGW